MAYVQWDPCNHRMANPQGGRVDSIQIGSVPRNIADKVNLQLGLAQRVNNRWPQEMILWNDPSQ
jgi:hypothetical protein